MSDSENNDPSLSENNTPSMKSSSFRKIKALNRGNFILRQELASYTQECNPKCGIICNICLIILFLASGLPVIFWTKNDIEYRQTYTDW